MKEIFLKDASVSLITVMPLEPDFSQRKPAIGVFVPLNETTLPVLDDTSESDSASVPAFIITDAQPADVDDPRNTQVIVSFNAMNEKTQEMTSYAFPMDIQFLALSMALSAVNSPAGGLAIYFINSDKYTPGVEVTTGVYQFAFALILPPKEETEGEEFMEKIAALAHEDYSTPLAPIGWDEISQDQSNNPLVRAAQSKLMMLLLGLARGEVSPLMEIISMEADIDQFESDEVSDEDANDPLFMARLEMLSICVQIAQNAYQRIANLNPEMQTAAKSVDNISAVDYNPQVDIIFSKLISDPGVEGIFKNVKISPSDRSPEEITRDKNIVAWNKPMSEMWPVELLPLSQYLSTLPDESVYRELVDMDYKNNDLVNEKIDEYGLGKIFTGLCISIVSYALKKGILMQNSHNVIFPPTVLLNDWTNIFEDDFPWELPALAGSLATYNFKNAVDVLTMYYEPAHQVDKAVYLWEVVHDIGHHLAHSDEWKGYSSDKLAFEFDSLGINTQEFSDFKSWILRYFRKIKELESSAEEQSSDNEHGGEGCVVAMAMSEFIDESLDVQKMAEIVSMSFPVFADIMAMRKGLSPDDDDWDIIRKTYIYTLLTSIADSFGDRIRIALR